MHDAAKPATNERGVLYSHLCARARRVRRGCANPSFLHYILAATTTQQKKASQARDEHIWNCSFTPLFHFALAYSCVLRLRVDVQREARDARRWMPSARA